MLDGIRHGFHILERESDIQPVIQPNYGSALQQKSQVENELIDQMTKGDYVIADRPPTIVSTLAAIPKDDGTVRLIHDGSRPVGKAINDYPLPEMVKFQTLQDAYRLAKPSYYCAKIDLQSAHTSVPIHPEDYKATCIHWVFEGDSEPQFLFDSRLPFGSNKRDQRTFIDSRKLSGVVWYVRDSTV